MERHLRERVAQICGLGKPESTEFLKVWPWCSIPSRIRSSIFNKLPRTGSPRRSTTQNCLHLQKKAVISALPLAALGIK